MKKFLSDHLSAWIHKSQTPVLVIIIFFICLLPMNFLNIYNAWQLEDMLTEQASESISAIQSSYAAGLYTRMVATENYMMNMIDEDTYLKNIQNQEEDTSYTLNKIFFAQEVYEYLTIITTADIYCLYLQDIDDFLYISKTITDSDTKSSMRDLCMQEIASLYSTQWKLIELEDTTYLGHALYQDGLYFAALIEVSSYAEEIKASIDYEGIAISITSDGAADQTADELRVLTTIENSNASICGVVQKQDIYVVLPFLQKHALLIAVMSLMIIPLLYGCIMFLVIRPLHGLKNAQEQLQTDPDYRIPAADEKYYTGEFLAVADSFNEMADNIEKLKIENYEQEISIQKVELENWELMIRPHFLQNVFMTLYAMCQTKQTESLGEFILFLSRYFQYIIRNIHQLTHFSEELQIIKGYMNLAAYQHPNAFDIQYEIAEELEDVLIPPLLILTFIENIISHALVHGRLVKIQLKLEAAEPGIVRFVIEDDGRGMDEQTLQRINEHEPVDHHGKIHFGMTNSYRRLDGIYHGRASMHVDSKKNQGTRIVVELPCTPDEEAL